MEPQRKMITLSGNSIVVVGGGDGEVVVVDDERYSPRDRVRPTKQANSKRNSISSF